MDTNLRIGCDDGRDSIKVVTGFNSESNSFNCFAIKSQAVRGKEQLTSFKGKADSAYCTEDVWFSVSGSNTSLAKYADTRYYEYQTSAHNRILIQHALLEANLSGQTVALATGLPLDLYYSGDGLNNDLISMKKASLLKPVTNFNNTPPVTISSSMVLGEGVAAAYDCLLNNDGSVNEEFYAMTLKRPITVIDLGGMTTDIATIIEGVGGVYRDQSGSADLGAIELIKDIGITLKSKLCLNNIPPDNFIEESFKTHTYEVLGRTEDISEILVKAAKNYVNKIEDFFVSKCRDGSNLGAVIFVGGGAALIQQILGQKGFSQIYKGKIILAPNPQFANAIGLWKAANYLFIDELK